MAQARLAELSEREFTSALDSLLAIYMAAMRPPQDQLSGRRMIMGSHTVHRGFRCVAAYAGADTVGFAYGFHGAPGQWWYDAVWRTLIDARGDAEGQRWLADTFEIAEVHVLPAHQGHGIGRRLVTELCADRTERTAVLSTRDIESPARRLYRSLGFADLLTAFAFPGGQEPYAVMGSALPLASARARRRPST